MTCIALCLDCNWHTKSPDYNIVQVMAKDHEERQTNGHETVISSKQLPNNRGVEDKDFISFVPKYDIAEMVPIKQIHQPGGFFSSRCGITDEAFYKVKIPQNYPILCFCSHCFGLGELLLGEKP